MPVFLTLGSVTFANFEIPEKINFGGSQALSVKQLVGGQRIVDAMGRIDDDISWSGLFFGATSTFRAQFLDAMRVAGVALPLTWGNFNYSVVIKDFKAQFERTYQIPYSITCTVVQDLNKPFPFLIPVLYNDAVVNLMVEANDLATAIANPSISNAMAVLSEAVALVQNFDIATSTQIASVLTPLGGAISVVTGTITALNLSVFGNSGVAFQIPANISATILESNVVAADFLEFGNLYLLQSILNNIGTNLTLISQGATGQKITVTNANLFQLAAKYYGDSNQWVTIANANGLTDPYVSGGTITNIIVTSGGIGYSDPVANFSGNQVNPATVFFELHEGIITNVMISTGGLFTNHPQLTITDPTGSGATFIINCAQTLIIPSSSTSLTGGLLVN